MTTDPALPGGWLHRPDGAPADDLDLAVLLLNSSDLLEDPPDRLTSVAWYAGALRTAGHPELAADLREEDLEPLLELRAMLRLVFTAETAEEAAAKATLNTLFHRDDVDPSRVAVVGHDYGAMYGSLIADSDPRIRTAVLGTPDATWGDWFLNFFGLTLTGQQAADYAAGFARLDPRNHLKRLGSGLMLQFATDDPFVTAAARATMTADAPRADVKVYAAQHQLNDQARADRDAFLTARLRLAPAS